MDITVIVRTLNEEKNIGRFCECYQWANRILVMDGGSTDDTVDIALDFRNTFLGVFPYKEKRNGLEWNPRGKHVNSLIEWAHKFNTDWIIFDDCDCVPTLGLQLLCGALFDNEHPQVNNVHPQVDMIFAHRMFIYGQDQWFPEMRLPKDGQSLWAWRSHVDVKAAEDKNTLHMLIPEGKTILRLLDPYCLLHYFYPDEDTHQQKKAQYVETKEVPEHYDPLTQFGRLEPLPEWAVWK